MALKTFVKVSGVNNLSDARYCAGMNVDQLGFAIEPDSANYTAADKFKEIADWVSGVDFVGEIENDQVNVADLSANYGLKNVQIEHLIQLNPALEAGLNVIFATNSIDKAQEAQRIANGRLSYILMEAEGLNDEITSLAMEVPVVLSSDFDPEEVLQLVETPIKGIAIKGGDEIMPGYKDFDGMADILEALEIDDLD